MVRIRQEPRFNILRCHVWNHKISGEKALFSEFWDFLLIWASFKCYFLIPRLNIMPGTNCHENITSQTQIINVNAFPWYSRMVSFRKNEGDFGTNSQHPYLGYHSGYKAQIWLFSFTIWTSMSNFMVFWKHGFQVPIICPCLMWNFPTIS